jgi:hypothetical protein
VAYLLFPGRHLLTTSFQEEYLKNILGLPVSKLELLGEYSGNKDHKIEHIIFAVTSANQANSRYNPVPFHFRCLGLDRFAAGFRDSFNVACSILPIPHFNPNEHFAEIVFKEISEQAEGQYNLSPSNTIVLCSTPALIEMYKNNGYAVLPAEYDYDGKVFKAKTPIDYIKMLAETKEKWEGNKDLVGGLSRATLSLWRDFPTVPQKILRLWRDPLLTESGSLTETRNYSTYAEGMGHKALLESKYNDIKSALIPGKIVDEGCADGALITLVCKDFPDSDIIGIELTSEFNARFLERQRAGEFGGTFVHVHQRNLMEKVFEDNSIDTTICNSTTHEIWSYGGGESSLLHYIGLKFDQLRKSGRLIIRDVVGPENKEREVYLDLNSTDGSNEDPYRVFNDREELREHLDSLSTHAKFLRFAQDYLNDMRKNGRRGSDTEIRYKEEVVDGKSYIVTSLKNACEFMTKKDYTENWQSELNEEFAFWSFSEWKRALSKAGFKIIENPNDPDNSSRAFAIPWVVDNRFKGKVLLYQKIDGKLEQMPYPVTNMVLVGEKKGNI